MPMKCAGPYIPDTDRCIPREQAAPADRHPSVALPFLDAVVRDAEISWINVVLSERTEDVLSSLPPVEAAETDFWFLNIFFSSFVYVPRYGTVFDCEIKRDRRST